VSERAAQGKVVKMPKAAQLLAAGLCSIPLTAGAAGTGPGKYLCVVSHLAGIQYPSSGGTSWGKFEPADKEFFVTIAPAQASDQCSKTWPPVGHIRWFMCETKFLVQMDNKEILRGDDASTFYSLVGGGTFSMTDDLTFTSIEDVFPAGRGLYVSDGKCTKVS
jgi:hypothetical protein